ncbi:MAG: ABC transporter ATP-binding protein [Chitinophagaceae bacterium]|nr:ABC transporter ATP-binding protein [Chitinophagaceae bacterium]
MNHLKALHKYLYKYRLRLAMGIVFITCSNLFGVYSPQVVRHAVDMITSQISYHQFYSKSGLDHEFMKLFGISILFFGMVVVVLAILRGIFLFFMRQTIIVMSRLIEYDQKNEIFAHYQKLHLDFYKRNNTGDLMSRITEDVSRVRMYTGPAIMYTINLLVLFIMVIYTMVRVNLELTLYTVAPLPILGYSIYYVNGIIQRKSEAIQRQLSFLTTISQESFSGIRVIKSYVQEKFMNNYFNQECENYRGNNLELAKVEAIYFPLIFLLVGLSTVLTIFIGGTQVIQGKITSGNIAEFVIYINMLTWPIASVGWVMALVQRAAASQKRIDEFLRVTPEITSQSSAGMKVKGLIEFRHVSFTYPTTGIHALKNVSFTVKPGERMAIIGRTGSGKSTLGQLIVRMYDPDSGLILLDGKEIKSLDLFALRRQIGYVSQDVFLFSDSVFNNIGFGMEAEDFDKEKVVEAATYAAVHSDILQLPEQYETIVGERGVTLSGGQKQRISIARALIKDPKVVVFDDCLSAVDAQTEKNILGYLDTFLHDRTTIIITHRIFSLFNFDKIIVIDDGAIAEEGNHDSLMRQKGVYYELFERQLLEEKRAVDAPVS